MTGSGPFSASTPTADTKRDRISSSTIPISYLKPPQLYNEAAEQDSSSRNRSTFTLSPVTTCSYQYGENSNPRAYRNRKPTAGQVFARISCPSPSKPLLRQ